MATAAKNIPYPHIVKTPGVCGGKACIDGTRLPVSHVIALHKEGQRPEEIVAVYPNLTLAQVYGALTYYYDHTQEIEQSLLQADKADVDFESRKAGFLIRRSS